MKIKTYYKLTKPGIIRGNLMTALAGYLYASGSAVDIWRLAAVLGGIAGIIACACVLNNYIDRDIDKKMARTKDRALVTGEITVRNAFICAGVLGLAGFWLLAAYTNTLTVIIGAVGIFAYVVLYGYFKRNSIHGTLVGSISGSTSLVAGYCAVTNRFDSVALLLFIIMAIWQMPHFYAIAVYRHDDYKKAKLPVLPVVKGIESAKKYIFGYILLYGIASALLALLGHAGIVYLIVMLGVCGYWISYAIKGFAVKDAVKYGHQIFGASLIVLLSFSILISTDRLLP